MLLRQQVRVTDRVWLDFLHHLCHGMVNERRIQMLKTLTLTDPECDIPDFSTDPWASASLVTPHHVVREVWNDEAVRQHCRISKQQCFRSPSDDTIRGRGLTKMERYISASKPKTKDQLDKWITLAIEMKILVTLNIETELDLANGARGMIIKIVLHPEEEVSTDQEVVLKHTPLYVLVKLDRTRAARLPGLEENVLPIEPALKCFKITYNTRHNGEIQAISRTIQR